MGPFLCYSQDQTTQIGADRRSRELLPEVKDREFLQTRQTRLGSHAIDRTCRTCRTCTLRKSPLPSSRHTKSSWNPWGFPRKWSSKCWVFHIFISSLGVAKIPMFCRKLHWSGQGSYTSPVVRGTVISSWCPENVRLWLLCFFFLHWQLSVIVSLFSNWRAKDEVMRRKSSKTGTSNW